MSLFLSSPTYNQCVPVLLGTNVLSRLPSVPFLGGSVAHVSPIFAQDQSEVAVYSTAHVTLPPMQATVISGRIGAARNYPHGVQEVFE